MLLVHAHPDDETLTTGGTMAVYAARGVRVVLVTCTLGEEGEIIPPHLAELGSWAGDQLGGYRDGELAAACAALGVTERHQLGGIGRWRDSGMAGTLSADHPRAFTGGDAGEQAAQLRAVIDEVRPQVVVTYDANGGYGHPDHIRAHRITMAATESAPSVRRVFHTVSSAGAVATGLAGLRERPELPFRVAADDELPTTPDEDIDTVVDVTRLLPAKVAALRAHATQITVGEDWFALSNDIIQPITATEHFVLARGEAGARTDLFEGLRP
ncbi:N-acetyl-1-D-myo-inositol-2-amino-2-deoxy-alpha-D-glucopyranoside deacetylase [Amycolatopsis suaedae]|uniref:1D-myo-inositol 2-acetamido-2-deoxy-alpha-D-glucopyranoside deacetylase n=1 Tax=Amycolatopsis suaedae TaxID=2510978 RepID=A0A4Q7J7K6_9PSEU|nr:N-acetyl-1-D-myo-inositol-2-amino-2-deoxy-alpha-D-glucopyranoside deacetylase [Amycolatopsis suaedae]RZQ63660.1 N-acetyl-1-D-myo-inositol-2-amino-2-deoxy-alpha-D-glucopyranoside deacetylase [Amycolatopsis suaedae]